MLARVANVLLCLLTLFFTFNFYLSQSYPKLYSLQADLLLVIVSRKSCHLRYFSKK